MTHLLDAMPPGWSLVRMDDGWHVYDHSGHLLNDARSTNELAAFLEHEVRCAQECAAYHWALKGPNPAIA